MRSTWHVGGAQDGAARLSRGLAFTPPGQACPSFSPSPGSGVAMAGIWKRRENVTRHRGGGQ